MSRALSVVIPVFRSQDILRELYAELISNLEQLGRPFEIIFVEDCGGDGAWDVIRELAARDDRVRGLKLSRNYGQHNAVLCGVRASKYDVIVTMDDDLQHPPSQIAALLSRLEEGYDVVYGVPEIERHGFMRGLASRLTKIALQSAMGVENARNVTAFRAFRGGLRKAFENYQSPSVSIDVLLSWGANAYSAVKVRHQHRRSGSSNYSFGKLVNHAFNLLTGFSTTPLRFVSLLGFSFTFFGGIVLAWVLGAYLLYGSSVPGFVFLATTVAIFSGVQLFALGIFGEYLARIFGRALDKPAYVLSETTPECASRAHVHFVEGRPA